MASKVTERTFKDSGYIYVRPHSDAKCYPTVEVNADGSMSEAASEAILAFVREIAQAENELGYLKNGFTFAETIESYSDSSDMGQLKVHGIADEKATNQFELFNANGATIEKLHPLAKSIAAADGSRLTNIGGMTNKDDTLYDILFVSPDTRRGDISIYTLGSSISGLTLSFKPKSVTPLQCNYEASVIDDTGVLAKIYEAAPGKRIVNVSTSESETTETESETPETESDEGDDTTA